MLGRRQIREKVVKTLYSYYQNPIKTDVLERNMLTEIEKIYHLYIYQLNFLVALKDLAEKRIEIGKNKFLKTDADTNPNQKFINNQVLKKLEENTERLSFTTKHQELKWDLHDDLLVKTFQKMVSGKRYQDFMQEEGYSFEEDQKFIGKLFLRYIAENEDFHEHLEEKELSWADDFHISNSMIQKTIGFLKENEPSHTLIKMIKDKEDEAFAKKLLQIWEEMKLRSFFKYNIDISKQEEHLEEFLALTFEEQKLHLCDILDKNQLYVNLSSLYDEDFKCTEDEIMVSKDFYRIKD